MLFQSYRNRGLIISKAIARHIALLLPIIFAQLAQRLYFIVDNRYITHLGIKAIYVHAIQINFVILGIFIGTAATTAVLILLGRKENSKKHESIILTLLLFTFLLSLLLAGVVFLLRDLLANYFNVAASYTEAAKTYFAIGAFNMLLLSMYITTSGVLLAKGKQKFSMGVSLILLMLKFVLDYSLIHFLLAADNKRLILIFIGYSNIMLYSFALLLNLAVLRKILSWNKLRLCSGVVNIWGAESAALLLRGFTPFIFVYQLSHVEAQHGFLATYQLVLDFVYVLCLPLQAASRLAVKEASAKHSGFEQEGNRWALLYVLTGVFPCELMLFILFLFPVILLKIVYGYTPPITHQVFIPLYAIACMLGQMGNAFSIPIRARKKSRIIAVHFVVCELFILVGGTQLLIYLHLETPKAIGLVSILFTGVYLCLNILSNIREHRKELARASI